MSLTNRAALLDAADPLAGFRSRFLLNSPLLGPGCTIYLDGNSLGPVSLDAEAALQEALESWRTHRIEGWTAGESPWLFLPETLGARLAPLVGAEPGEVIATGSTTVNLHQLLATLYDGHGKVLIDAGAFPTDRYALQSHLALRGRDPNDFLTFCPPDDDALDLALKSGVTLAVLPSVVYTSGRLLDMARLTRTARENGVTILWDLSHSIGAVPHSLSAIGADGAFWCSYKWLSAGPGAVGGLYLNACHHPKAPGMAGWFVADRTMMFSGSDALSPAPGAARLQLGTTHVFSLAPLAGSLNLFEDAGIGAIREKSLALTGFLREALASLTPEMATVTPVEDARRGGHLTLRHPQAASLSVALRAVGVVGDHRPPDLLRLAPAPLFTSFSECLEAVRRLRTVLDSGVETNAAGLVP